MPELPEVETTRRSIEPHLLGQVIAAVNVRNRQLRWPVPKSLEGKLQGEVIEFVKRRGKYILLQTARGTTLFHLGMSGSLRIVDAGTPAEKHDHVDLLLINGKCLRLRDPRRFGSVLWAGKNPSRHKLLKALGPEPLGENFTGEYLHSLSHKRSQTVKTFIMDSHIVVGIGNIYASEALFRCGINPKRAAGRIAKHRYERLATATRQLLEEAIRSGGTSLRDFVSGAGEPGYFAQNLNVYGRADQPCYLCDRPVHQITLGQRSTFYCPKCQH